MLDVFLFQVHGKDVSDSQGFAMCWIDNKGDISGNVQNKRVIEAKAKRPPVSTKCIYKNKEGVLAFFVFLFRAFSNKRNAGKQKSKR